MATQHADESAWAAPAASVLHQMQARPLVKLLQRSNACQKVALSSARKECGLTHRNC